MAFRHKVKPNWQIPVPFQNRQVQLAHGGYAKAEVIMKRLFPWIMLCAIVVITACQAKISPRGDFTVNGDNLYMQVGSTICITEGTATFESVEVVQGNQIRATTVLTLTKNATGTYAAQGSFTVESCSVDVQPTVAPVQPTVEVAQPTVAPVQPTVEVAQPTVAPVQPTVEVAQPTIQPVNGLVVDHSGAYCQQELGWAQNAANLIGEVHVYGDAINFCHLAKDVTGMSAEQMREIRDLVGGLLQPNTYAFVAGGLWANHPNPPEGLNCDTTQVTILKWYRSNEVAGVGHVADLCD